MFQLQTHNTVKFLYQGLDAHLNIIALTEPVLEMIKGDILTEIHDDYINK